MGTLAKTQITAASREIKKSKSDEQFTEPFRVEETLKVLESNHFHDI